jgi:hypothetical protein
MSTWELVKTYVLTPLVTVTAFSSVVALFVWRYKRIQETTAEVIAWSTAMRRNYKEAPGPGGAAAGAAEGLAGEGLAADPGPGPVTIQALIAALDGVKIQVWLTPTRTL